MKKLIAVSLALILYCATVEASVQGMSLDSKRTPRIVMLGDSLTAGCNWSEYLPGFKVYNLGVSGDSTQKIFNRLSDVQSLRPDIIFLMAGINDFASVELPQEIVARHGKIWRRLKFENPEALLYVISILPVSGEKYPGLNRKVRMVNAGLRQMALRHGLQYIEMHAPMADDEGSLQAAFTYDGLHLTKEAYKLWVEILKPYMSMVK